MNREEQIQAVVESLAKCQRPILNAGWKKLGLSHAQMGMLYLLFYHHEASVKQAADFLGISKSAVSQLTDPLVAKGFVSRRNDPADRRIVRMGLTADGSQVLKKLAKYKFAGIRSAIDSLGDKDVEQLYRLHQKMSENIS
jgi:DNA-binding MarR family transcriptional regulator